MHALTAVSHGRGFLLSRDVPDWNFGVAFYGAIPANIITGIRFDFESLVVSISGVNHVYIIT